MLFCAFVSGTSNLIERWSRALRVVKYISSLAKINCFPFWTRTGDVRGDGPLRRCIVWVLVTKLSVAPPSSGRGCVGSV